MRLKAQYSNNAGFTLLENIIVLAIIGILCAITAPNWIGFVNRQRLNTAQHQVYRGMQETKSQAMLQKVTWQFSIREVTVNGKPVVQWAVHPKSLSPANAIWHNLDSHIRLYRPETTFYKDKKNGIQRVQFNYIGNTNGQLGQLTLVANNSDKVKRCVYVSTLIGTMRMGKEHPKANSSKKYCY
jgi:prepilin-type N-terminal cleavage/methylation domain-containing protein